MAARVDFKQPSLVVVGHWNAAILNEPGWIARHLLNTPEGQRIDLQAVVVGNQVSPNQIKAEKHIWLLDGYGFSCKGQRLEFYTRDENDRGAMMAAATAICTKLPHTPISAAGVNFVVNVADEFALPLEKLSTSENVEQYGQVASVERREVIGVLSNDCISVDAKRHFSTDLNIVRKSDFNSLEINFNYHTPVPSVAEIPDWLRMNPIDHWWAHAKKVLLEVYEINEYAADYLE